MLAQDVLALGNVELPLECILKVKSFISDTRGFMDNFHSRGTPAAVLRDLARRLHFSAFKLSWFGWNP